MDNQQPQQPSQDWPAAEWSRIPYHTLTSDQMNIDNFWVAVSQTAKEGLMRLEPRAMIETISLFEVAMNNFSGEGFMTSVPLNALVALSLGDPNLLQPEDVCIIVGIVGAVGQAYEEVKTNGVNWLQDQINPELPSLTLIAAVVSIGEMPLWETRMGLGGL